MIKQLVEDELEILFANQEAELKKIKQEALVAKTEAVKERFRAEKERKEKEKERKEKEKALLKAKKAQSQVEKEKIEKRAAQIKLATKMLQYDEDIKTIMTETGLDKETIEALKKDF
jgi:hypothetical protein